jgi:hypothetical protein
VTLKLASGFAMSWRDGVFAGCPITENGLLRVLGDPNDPNSPGAPSAVRSALAAIPALPGHASLDHKLATEAVAEESAPLTLN